MKVFRTAQGGTIEFNVSNVRKMSKADFVKQYKGVLFDVEDKYHEITGKAKKADK